MEEEKAEFARRLRAALRDAGIEASAVVLEVKFNSRYGGTPVTAQAISGWLNGRYLPKQDKLRVLAQLVGIDPHELRFGGGEKRLRGSDEQKRNISATDQRTIDTFLALPPKLRELAREMIAVMGTAALGGQ